MQAIILAAGMGKRLGHLTSANTKCMVQVNNRTLIERMLSHLKNLKLTRIIIVIGYMGQNVRNHVGETFDNITIRYVVNPVYDKTNNIYSLYLAKDFLMEDDTLLLESDLIIEEDILQRLVKHPYPNLAVVAKFESWMDGTVVSLDENDNILSFVPKKNFRYQDIPLYFKTVNIYKFSKQFSRSHYVPFLDAYCKALGNNEYYEQVLRVITLLEKPDIKALRLGCEKWYEIDDIQDLDNAQTIFAEPGNKLIAYQKRGGGYWRYPELIDFSNPSNAFFPTEVLKKEISTNFETLLNAHPSDLSVNRLLAAKNFSIDQKYIVVANSVSELVDAYLVRTELSTGVLFPFFEQYCNKRSKEKFIPFNLSENDFAYTVSDLVAFFTENPCKQLLLVNPHNISGSYIPLPELTGLLAWAKSQAVKVILDESFIDFANHSETMLSNSLLEKYPNLLVIRDVSVSQGIPGIQLAIAASADVNSIEDINAQLSRFKINSITEFYMQIFGKYEKEYISSCNQMIEEREKLQDELSRIRYLEPIPSNANFILCKVTAKFTAKEVAYKLLRDHNILVQDSGEKQAFKGNNYIQFSVRDRNDNDKLTKALKNVLS